MYTLPKECNKCNIKSHKMKYDMYHIENEYKLVVKNNNSLKFHKIIYGNEIDVIDLPQIHNHDFFIQKMLELKNKFLTKSLDIEKLNDIINKWNEINEYFSCEKFIEENTENKKKSSSHILARQIQMSFPEGQLSRNLEELAQEKKIYGQKETEYNKLIMPRNESIKGFYSYLKSNKYLLFFNDQFNKIHMVNGTGYETVNFIKSEMNELILVSDVEFTDEQYKKFSEYFSKNLFIDISEASEYINENIKFNKPSKNKIEKQILKSFDLSDCIEDRIQFTDIYNIIVKENNIHDEKYKRFFKNKLPIVLVNLKLNKKRYTKGVYWYGLKKKIKKCCNNTQNTKYSIMLTGDKIHCKRNKTCSYEDILKKREEEDKTYEFQEKKFTIQNKMDIEPCFELPINTSGSMLEDQFANFITEI